MDSYPVAYFARLIARESGDASALRPLLHSRFEAAPDTSVPSPESWVEPDAVLQQPEMRKRVPAGAPEVVTGVGVSPNATRPRRRLILPPRERGVEGIRQGSDLARGPGPRPGGLVPPEWEQSGPGSVPAPRESITSKSFPPGGRGVEGSRQGSDLVRGPGPLPGVRVLPEWERSDPGFVPTSREQIPVKSFPPGEPVRERIGQRPGFGGGHWSEGAPPEWEQSDPVFGLTSRETIPATSFPEGAQTAQAAPSAVVLSEVEKIGHGPGLTHGPGPRSEGAVPEWEQSEPGFVPASRESVPEKSLPSGVGGLARPGRPGRPRRAVVELSGVERIGPGTDLAHGPRSRGVGPEWEQSDPGFVPTSREQIPVKSFPREVEAARVEAARVEAARGEVARGEVARGEVAREEVAREEVARGQVAREEVARAEVAAAAEVAAVADTGRVVASRRREPWRARSNSTAAAAIGAASPTDPAQPAPIRVRIGRIDARSSVPKAARTVAPTPPPRPNLTLDQYIERRRGRQR